MEESYFEFLVLMGQPITKEEIVEICKKKHKRFSLEASCSKELGIDEYLKVRKQIGREKMFTCKNLKMDGSAIDKLIEYMHDRRLMAS